MTVGHDGTEKGRTRTGRRGVISQSELQASLSRRDFLRRAWIGTKRLGYGSLSLALLSKLGPKLIPGNNEETQLSPKGITIEPAGGTVPAIGGEKQVFSGRDLVDVAFQNPSKEKAEIQTEVNQLKAKFKEEQVDKSIVRAKELDSRVRDKVIGRGHLPPEAADLVMGLLIVESGGDPKALAQGDKPQDQKAAGLVQIMPAMARSYNMKVANDEDDERFNVDLSLDVLVSELTASYERWGNWGFALWEWHVGAPKIYEIVNLWGRDWEGEYLPNIDVSSSYPNAPIEAARRIGLYKQKIDSWDINVYKLFQYGKIRDMFKGEEWNKTDEYLLRVVAASELYKEVSFR